VDDPDVRRYAQEILEGGREAFRDRERKYGITEQMEEKAP
jgi:hypothetical protein